MPVWAQAYLTAENSLFYPVVFLLLLSAGLGFPVSADFVLLTVGFVAYQGKAEYRILIPLSIVAILVSDACMYWIGKNLGNGLTRVWPLKKVLTAERIEKAKDGFQKQGYRIVFSARFMPGIRTVFMFTSGLLNLRFWKFVGYDLMGALIVVPLTIFSVKWVAGNLDAVMVFMKKGQWFVLSGAAIVALCLFFRKSKRMTDQSVFKN